MSNDSGNENNHVAYVHRLLHQEEIPSDSEPMSEDESSDDDELSYELDDANYDPIREEDIFAMLEMIQANGAAVCYPIKVKSCEVLNEHKYCTPPASSRSLFSWSGADPLQELQGRLYRFYSPQYGHAELKRCVSEIEINILPSQSYDCDYSSEDNSEYSPVTHNVSLMDDSTSASCFVEDSSNYQIDDLCEMFENMHISTHIIPRRVRKIFNLKTWTEAICKEPTTPNGQPCILPIEKCWQFVEFTRSTPSTPGKRFADWYTTEDVPLEKKRKDRKIS